MTLGQKQRLFSKLAAKLILMAYELGFEISLGHAFRSTQEAKRLGFEGSLHCSKLAIDLNLFRDGKYLRTTEAHEPLGRWWKRQHPDCRWGGDFRKKDGNHYSIAYGNRA